METRVEREAKFRKALTEFLASHDATIEITDDAKPYGLASGVLDVYMPADCDERGNLTKEFCQFRL